MLYLIDLSSMENMGKTLTYQTSAFNSCHLIFKDSINVGKLFKLEWIGSPVEASINDSKYKFFVKGFFNPTISILDKDKNQNIGEVKVKSFFKFNPTAHMRLADGTPYFWKIQGYFRYFWEWRNQGGSVIMRSSNKESHLFDNEGTIRLFENTTDEDLMVALGIQLQQITQRKNAFTQIIGLIGLIFFLLNQLSHLYLN
ncbi:MAG TPA: hypothetical protein PKD18_09175 [Saprospiraceae bacterium]|nr:hypothetical protein [Saprospiraceae bacterium]